MAEQGFVFAVFAGGHQSLVAKLSGVSNRPFKAMRNFRSASDPHGASTPVDVQDVHVRLHEPGQSRAGCSCGSQLLGNSAVLGSLVIILRVKAPAAMAAAAPSAGSTEDSSDTPAFRAATSPYLPS